MTRRIVMTAAAMVVAAMGIDAQGHPDFSGAWVPDATKTAAMRPASSGGGGGGVASIGASGGGGGAMVASPGGTPPATTVTQTAAQLTIERSTPAGTQKTVYKLDGSESTNVNGSTTLVTKSHWDGTKLITEGKQTTKLDSATTEGTFKEMRSLDKDGDMVVETTRQFAGRDAVTGFQVLKKRG